MRTFRALLEDLKVSLLKTDVRLPYMHRSCMIFNTVDFISLGTCGVAGAGAGHRVAYTRGRTTAPRLVDCCVSHVMYMHAHICCLHVSVGARLICVKKGRKCSASVG